jgi:hypothetical protein
MIRAGTVLVCLAACARPVPRGAARPASPPVSAAATAPAATPRATTSAAVLRNEAKRAGKVEPFAKSAVSVANPRDA